MLELATIGIFLWLVAIILALVYLAIRDRGKR